jgi:PhzF family phenazine biosynthesis protein
MKYQYKQVDVFTHDVFRGNPVAVVFDADRLNDAEMQSIASWTNLSETTFVQSSDRADYKLRIFTPRSELPFAGHPTVGSAHAILEASGGSAGRRKMVQECRAGLIPIEIDDKSRVLARVPTPKVLALRVDDTLLRGALGSFEWDAPMIVDIGPKWMVTRLETFDDLYNLPVDFPALAALSRKLNAVGINLYALDNNNQVHVRSFAPAVGVMEDPVCGSGNAAVATHIRVSKLDGVVGSEYTAQQGSALGRNGRVHVRLNGIDVYIGGDCVTAIDGSISA